MLLFNSKKIAVCLIVASAYEGEKTQKENWGQPLGGTDFVIEFFGVSEINFQEANGNLEKSSKTCLNDLEFEWTCNVRKRQDMMDTHF